MNTNNSVYYFEYFINKKPGTIDVHNLHNIWIFTEFLKCKPRSFEERKEHNADLVQRLVCSQVSQLVHNVAQTHKAA